MINNKKNFQNFLILQISYNTVYVVRKKREIGKNENSSLYLIYFYF